MRGQDRAGRIGETRASERSPNREDVVVPDGRHFFVQLAIGTNRHHAVGEHEVAWLQSARKRANDASPDYQLCTGYQFERAARGFRCATMTDSVAHSRKRFAADLRTEAMQAVECERSAIVQPSLERRDFPREGVEEKNQPRDLILIFQESRLSERDDTIKIVPVFLADRGGAV